MNANGQAYLLLYFAARQYFHFTLHFRWSCKSLAYMFESEVSECERMRKNAWGGVSVPTLLCVVVLYNVQDARLCVVWCLWVCTFCAPE